MAKVTFVVTTDNISGLKLLDMDSPEWAAKPIREEDMVGVECIKADGVYLKVPKGELSPMEVLKNDDNIISEFEALGLNRIVKKYLAEHVEISASAAKS